ncbi:unnamed protein product [Sphagnum jensenii]|uniref:Uncharacterized protein n=1 Tax=Sphagnum jensenii TaxID=128206 RepID=A0ABP1BXA5_9BRYO
MSFLRCKMQEKDATQPFTGLKEDADRNAHTYLDHHSQDRSDTPATTNGILATKRQRTRTREQQQQHRQKRDPRRSAAAAAAFFFFV